MIVWLDAQLPPTLALWVTTTFGIDAKALRDLGLRDAKDRDIFMAARKVGAVVISKDSDFVELVQSLGAPPQVVWLTCGNVANARLKVVLAAAWPRVAAMLAAGEPIVELGDWSSDRFRSHQGATHPGPRPSWPTVSESQDA
jgi:predicted nuclease of predicted toxin-antitoxin system